MVVVEIIVTSSNHKTGINCGEIVVVGNLIDLDTVIDQDVHLIIDVTIVGVGIMEEIIVGKKGSNGGGSGSKSDGQTNSRK